MPKIVKLPDDLANQIAAGEVVERPASVTKELVENALDAGATTVTVSLAGGGVDELVVTDNGEGMSPEDAVLALERHATSKIRVLEDLAQLQSFGFRGEALPSIASVSELSLTTRQRGAKEALLLEVFGGGAPRVTPTSSAEGTAIRVANLFFNVPARKKFLKSTATESAHVGEVVVNAALARPDVTLRLSREGRLAKEYLRAASREARARDVFGGEVLHRCAGERAPHQIEAFLSAPERARAGATGLYLFVNGRPVKDRALARSVAQAYGSVLEPGRYPVGVVYVEMPLDLVDVNVHPQKAEVRFANARALHDAITRILHDGLAKALSLPALGAPGRPWFNPNTSASSTSGPSALPSGSFGPTTGATYGRTVPELAIAEPLFSNAPGASPRGFYGRLRYLGQARGMFLVCEGDDGVYVLDQHAAAERVLFHQLRKAHEARDVAMELLLVPEILTVSADEVLLTERSAEEMRALGVDARPVSPTTIAIHGVPRLLRARASAERVVRDLLAELGRVASGRPFSSAIDLVLATMACHGSIRAGDILAPEEVAALFAALDDLDFSGHCPHGRPVVTRLSFDDLERRVGR